MYRRGDNLKDRTVMIVRPGKDSLDSLFVISETVISIPGLSHIFYSFLC